MGLADDGDAAMHFCREHVKLSIRHHSFAACCCLVRVSLFALFAERRKEFENITV